MGHFRPCPYLLSQYVWFIFLLALVGIPILTKWKQTTPSFPAPESIPEFNSTYDPQIFVHLSDLHISTVYLDHNDKYADAIRFIHKINPDLVINTGDMSDNLPTDKLPLYGWTNRQMYDIYNNMTKAISDYKLIEIPGNHDEWALYDFNSKHHYYAIDRNLTENYFYVHTIKTNGFYFVCTAPFIYPTGHTPMVFYPAVSNDFMELLEHELSKIEPFAPTFLLTHFPLNMFHDNDGKSTKDKGFYETVTDNRVHYVLSGHLHPEEPVIKHHKNVLEFIGSDFNQHKAFGVLTEDNGRVVYHAVETDDYDKCYLTNPIPKEQLSSHTPFGEKTQNVRLVCIGNELPKVTVNGQKMKCRKSRTNSLCELKVTFEDGENELKFEGDYNNEYTIIVDDKSPKYVEPYPTATQTVFFTAALVELWVIAFIITIPIPFGFKKGEWWIEGLTDKGHFIMATVGGMFIVKERLLKLPTWLQWFLFFAVLYPLVLPLCGMEIDGHIGYITFYGFYGDNVIQRSSFGEIYTVLYFGLVIMFGILFLSSMALPGEFKMVQIIDFIVMLAGIIIFYYLLVRHVMQTVDVFYGLANFCYFLCPIVIYASGFLYRFWYRDHKDDFYRLPNEVQV